MIFQHPEWSWMTLTDLGLSSEGSLMFFRNLEGACKWPWSTTWNPKVRALNLTVSLWVGLGKRLTQFRSMFLQFTTRSEFRWDPSTSVTQAPSVLCGSWGCRIIRPTSLPATASIAINLQIKSRKLNGIEKFTGIYRNAILENEWKWHCALSLTNSVLLVYSEASFVICLLMGWQHASGKKNGQQFFFAVEKTGTLLHAGLFCQMDPTPSHLYTRVTHLC